MKHTSYHCPDSVSANNHSIISQGDPVSELDPSFRRVSGRRSKERRRVDVVRDEGAELEYLP